MGGDCLNTILGHERALFAGLSSRVERLDRPAPGRALAIVDLAPIKHRPPHRPAAADPAVLTDAPRAVRRAVVAAKLAA